MPAHTIYCWYIVDNSVKEVYCFTWKSHFGCFRLFRGCFRPFRGCFRPKKNIKNKNKNKKQRTSPTEHFFSPGSSTRILSEYLKIWIKSLSAWVFSFRRRLIFEVRLKFRPFGRYRYNIYIYKGSWQDMNIIDYLWVPWYIENYVTFPHSCTDWFPIYMWWIPRIYAIIW